jgi:hypothetical protein
LGQTFLGLGDGFLTLVGLMPRKPLRVQAFVLMDATGQQATAADVQAGLDLAKSVFADQLHVHLIELAPVSILPEIPPPRVLTPGCDEKIWGAQFTWVGA